MASKINRVFNIANLADCNLHYFLLQPPSNGGCLGDKVFGCISVYVPKCLGVWVFRFFWNATEIIMACHAEPVEVGHVLDPSIENPPLVDQDDIPETRNLQTDTLLPSLRGSRRLTWPAKGRAGSPKQQIVLKTDYQKMHEVNDPSIENSSLFCNNSNV